MATIETTTATLHVRLTRFEKFFGLLRDLEVPRFATAGVVEVAPSVAAGVSVGMPVRIGVPADAVRFSRPSVDAA